MKCRNPYVQGDRAYGCGQCMPCRLNRRRVWTHRIMLEALQHGDNSFATLTYDEDHLPADRSLNPKDVQGWLKRLRKEIEPKRVRFFMVGEYGDNTERPHYHAALFGFPCCAYGCSRYTVSRRNCCPACDLIRDTWGRGQIMLGTLELHSAQYVAGYVTKKLTSKEDSRLRGRHPEFARMSLKPGIGADAVPELASVFLSLDLESSQADVPVCLRHGRKLLPLGRYLRRRFREQTFGSSSAPAILQPDVRALWETAQADGKDASPEVRRAIFKSLLVGASDQAVASLEARQSIYKGRRTL